MSDLAFLGAVELGRRIARRELSSTEATRAMLERIERLDPKLRAYARVTAELALAQAARADAELTAGRSRGPLHGVPVAVKDLCDTAGIPTAVGMPMFRDRRPERDATVVRRLEAAGAVLLGKLQLSEAALALHHPDIPLPVNPWRADLWTGSSSSGSGVATAAGLCYAAIGSDTGGSIRFPSLANRLVGIKPTWGRVSRQGVFALSWTLDHVGTMARSVEDAAALLGAVAGRDEEDPTTLAGPVPDYLGGLGGDLAGVRLGYDEPYATAGVRPDIVAAVERAIAILRGCGAALVPVRMPPVKAAIAAWTPICLAEAAASHAAQSLYPQRAAEYSASLREFLDAGLAVRGVDYANANLARRQLAGNLAQLFQGADLMIVPVTPSALPTVEAFARICPDAEGLERLIYFTCIYDVSGNPVITLPAGMASDGTPLGLQLVARHGEEALLCRAGARYLGELGSRERPPLAA